MKRSRAALAILTASALVFGLTYTFHLRDAQWSNGDPVTASDFVFAWQRAVDPAVASEYAYMLSDIGQIKNAEAIIAECTTGDLCTDAEGRWARLYDAEKIVPDEAVIFPLYTQCNAEMMSAKVTGVESHPVALNRVYKNAVKAD